jgi:hypothetical protein
MLDIMTTSNADGPMPLYFQTVSRVLGEMRIVQQKTGGGFSYRDFRAEVTKGLTPAQLGPLKQRLDTLESFMPKEIGSAYSRNGGKEGTDWKHIVSSGGGALRRYN